MKKNALFGLGLLVLSLGFLGSDRSGCNCEAKEHSSYVASHVGYNISPRELNDFFSLGLGITGIIYLGRALGKREE